MLYPHISGLLGTILILISITVTTNLGLIQKDYSHKRNMVSELIVGNYGWIQEHTSKVRVPIIQSCY